MRKFILIQVVLFLTLPSYIFSKKIIPLRNITGPPELIRVDEHQIYVTESVHAYIYSLKDFKLVRVFGRKGEGPGEFMVNIGRYLLWIETQPESIIINSMGKISYFSKKGELLKEAKTNLFNSHQFFPLKEKLVGITTEISSKTMYWTINIYDSNFKINKELYRYLFSIQMAQPDKPINPIEFGLPEFRLYDNKIFVADRIDEGTIYVFNQSGKKIYSLLPKYTKKLVTEVDKKRYIDNLNVGRTKVFYERIKHRIKFSKYFPSLRFMDVDNNRIYVMTYNRKNDKSEFIIFDVKGKMLKRVYISIKDMRMKAHCPFTIKNNNIYYFEDSEDGAFELHIDEIK